ncbi:MAG: biosynthetic-type acetolactate synthase large subunit [Phycisphaeraceae bacterium]
MTDSALTTDIASASAGPRCDKYVGKTGAQIFHDMMAEHGVTAIFGYPGGAILPVFDAIYQSKAFQFILSRHEQGAGHMAEGLARVTGRPGVALVTSGPGATNIVTPIADAWMDGTPLIVFSGQVATGVIGTDAFQEADVTGITRPCTKWNVLVKDVRDLPRRINEAFHIATTGRPGPVLLDLPKDMTASTLTQPVRTAPYLPGYAIRELGASANIDRAAEMINRAKRPLLYVGQGAILSNAVAALREAAIRANIPVTTTLMGLGAFDEDHPLSMHMLGMHGSAYANWAMDQADVIIALGARFDDRVTGDPRKFARGAREAERRGEGGIIHFDISPEQINKIIQATVVVQGDARQNLEAMLPLLKFAPRTDWIEQCDRWKAEHPFRYQPDEREAHLKPQQVIEELDKQTRGEAIITTGVGQHQMWAAQFYTFKHPRQWVTSGGLGTMGFGVPASIGAQLARPDKQVINIDGDGSFCMTGHEMNTASQYNIPAKTIILNNDFQGMVKQWQDLFYQERYSHTQMHNPDFVKLAEAMHCKGFRVTKAADLPKVMEAFLAHDGPAIMDAVVEKHEHVYPMMPAGKSVDDMVLGPKPK